MEYIKINEKNAILSLSAEEAAEYRGEDGIAVKRIVREAEERYGCSHLDGRLYVQMYEMKDGGCELFLTRLGERRREMATLSETNSMIPTEYHRCMYRDECAVYVFDKLEALLLCCKMIDGAGYRGRSEAYADRTRGEYYLVLERKSDYPAEMMGRECSTDIITYVREHCKQIFGERAATLLGQLARSTRSTANLTMIEQ